MIGLRNPAFLGAVAAQAGVSPLAFVASPFDGWNATQTSITDTQVTVAYRNLPVGAANRPRRMGFALSGTNGRAPSLRVALSPAYEAEQAPAVSGHACWATDPDGTTWNELAIGTTGGGFRTMTFPTLPAGPVYVQTMPCASVGRMRAKVDEWIADELTRPTESGDENCVIGTLSGITGPGSTAIPAFDIRAFTVGNGPRIGVLVGCSHPDEPASWWALEGMVEAILADATLRSQWTFHVYPEFNLQGAWGGYTRIDPASSPVTDANRVFDAAVTSPLKTLYRAVWAADFDTAEFVCDYHGSLPDGHPFNSQTGGDTTFRYIFHRTGVSSAGAVAAWKTAMGALGLYAFNDTTSTEPGVSISTELQSRLAATALQLISEGRPERGVTPADYIDFGADQAAALAAITLDIWPDAPTETAPAQFGTGQWSVAPGDGQATLTISALPDDGGSAITSLQYRLDEGTPVTLSGTGTGARTITGLTNGETYSVQVRAVNAVGNGEWSVAKTVSPFEPGTTVLTPGDGAITVAAVAAMTGLLPTEGDELITITEDV